MPPQPPKYHDPIKLRTAAIIDGVYYRAGEVLPYTAESELPENLRPLVATGEEEAPFDPAERDFYRPNLRREARRILGNVQWQDQAEAEAEARVTKYFVKRGGEMARCERAKLRPGEQCFTRQGDEWVYAGVIDSTGAPPPQPITT